MIDKTLERLDFILRRKNDNTNFPPRNPSNGFDEICEMDAKDPQEIQFKLRVRVKEGEIFEIWRRKLTLEIFSDWMKKTKRKPRGDDCFDESSKRGLIVLSLLRVATRSATSEIFPRDEV